MQVALQVCRTAIVAMQRAWSWMRESSGEMMTVRPRERTAGSW
jgi:hypothetical protein